MVQTPLLVRHPPTCHFFVAYFLRLKAEVEWICKKVNGLDLGFDMVMKNSTDNNFGVYHLTVWRMISIPQITAPGSLTVNEM